MYTLSQIVRWMATSFSILRFYVRVRASRGFPKGFIWRLGLIVCATWQDGLFAR